MRGVSGCDLVFVCDPAGDLFAADPVLGEVDLRWPGAGLSRCELAAGTVRPGGVVAQQVFGQYPAQMVLIYDQQPVEEFAARDTITLSQMPFAFGARGGLARILIPSAMNTASKERVNWPARPLIRNLNKVTRWPRSVTTLRAACVAHAPTGCAVTPAR
jgi:hypothetical protein